MSSGRSPAEAPVVNITGESVLLGPLVRELVPLYQRWLNNLHHARNFGDTPAPWAHERTLALFDERAGPSSETAFFTIYERATSEPIGYTMLLDITFRHRSAELAIHIGEDRAHGKGYGTETAGLMLAYAFETLNLHAVYLMVAEFNLAGRHAYERAGFRESGRYREAWEMGSRYWDAIIMDCLASEYRNRRGCSSH
jgi:RimJ/RimL family protein N-acetyltransferase